MLVISITGIVSIQTVSNESNTMYAKNLSGISALGSYQYSFMTMRLSSYKVSFTTDAAAKKGADLKSVNVKYFAEMDSYLKTYKDTINANSEKELKLYNDLEALHTSYKTANQNVVDAYNANKSTDDINALITTNAGISTDLNTKLNEVMHPTMQMQRIAPVPIAVRQELL